MHFTVDLDVNFQRTLTTPECLFVLTKIPKSSRKILIAISHILVRLIMDLIQNRQRILAALECLLEMIKILVRVGKKPIAGCHILVRFTVEAAKNPQLAPPPL